MCRDPKGYYRLFRVAPDATTDEIKRSYRQLAQKLHPDKSEIADSTRIFQFITEVHSLLTNPKTRKKYDPLWDENFQLIDFNRLARMHMR